MKRMWMVLGPFVLFLFAPAFSVEASAQHLGVTICHRTGATGNAFVAITPDRQSIIEAHIEPIAHPPKNGRVDFLLPFPNGTRDDCREADDPPDDPGDDTPDDPGDGTPDDPGDDTPDDPGDGTPDDPGDDTPDNPGDGTPDNPDVGPVDNLVAKLPKE